MHIHPPVQPEYNPKKRLGKLHVYTGEGKGKTSAALGAALRAAGHGYRTLIIQFIDANKHRGEVLAIQQLGDHIELIQFGRDDVQTVDQLHPVDGYLAEQGLEYARMRMKKQRPDVLVLDELATALHHDLLVLEDVLDFLDNRHRNTEVIITGRNAHPALLNAADLVTIMDSTKQYFDHHDFSPRLGIEQ